MMTFVLEVIGALSVLVGVSVYSAVRLAGKTDQLTRTLHDD